MQEGWHEEVQKLFSLWRKCKYQNVERMNPPALIGSHTTTKRSNSRQEQDIGMTLKMDSFAGLYHHEGEPKGTEFRSYIFLLFPTQSEISASGLLCLPPALTLITWLIILRFCRLGQNVSLKRLLTVNGLHCVTSKKIALFITNALRTSDSISFFRFKISSKTSVLQGMHPAVSTYALAIWSVKTQQF
jgi:hypothetical protein